MSYSWSLVWRVGPWVLFGIAACGSDPGPCGEGTVLKDGKCIPQCGAGTVLVGGQCVIGGGGGAGSAGQGGAKNEGGSSGSEDADAGNAGESEADAGSAGAGDDHSGGSGGNSGPSFGGGGTAGAAFGGSGGGAGGSFGGGGGSAGSGLAGSSGAGPRPQWLALNQSDGLFAYDLSKFPSTLVSLESKSMRAPSWSPDGHWLLYQKIPAVYCRDMTSAVPGTALLKATVEYINNQVVDSLTWSADSKTAALAIAPVTPAYAPRTLQVFDPTEAVPTLRTLSTSAGWHSWAPAGDRIMYWESNAVRVRRVQSGVPEPDVALDGNGSSYSWSPDGKAVAYYTSTDVYLIDVTQAAPAAITLTSPSVAAPTVEGGASFNPDGTSVLFQGVQVRDGQQDLFKVTLKPSVGAPVRLSTGLTGTASAIGYRVSPDGKWVIYTVSEVGKAATTWAVDLSGANPGAPFQISTQTIVELTWVPNGSGNLLGSNSVGLTITNVATAATTPLGVSAGNNYSLAPAFALLAYGVTPAAAHLYVRDLNHLDTPAGDIPFLLSTGVRSWSWSPNGKFIATVEGVNSFQLRLVQLEGLAPSNALAVSTTTSTPYFYWQPVSN